MNIATEITVFRDAAAALGVFMHLESPGEDMFIFSSKDQRNSLCQTKPIDLTLMALTHGNEVSGISVLNKILIDVAAAGGVNFNFAVALGNTEAARASQRFLKADLNRSFGRSEVSCSEHSRAKNLADHILRKTFLLVDLHQTIEPSESPFFIFPFSLKGYRLARHICGDTPIVSHWHGGFSKDGMCTDEYVNHCGGTGISLELGQMGFDGNQISYGSDLLLRFIKKMKSAFDTASLERKISPEEQENQLWTWAHIEPYPKEKEIHLIDELHNFKEVQKDSVIAKCADGSVLTAPLTAPIMFPKYRRDNRKPKPSELIRYLRKSCSEELSKIGFS